MTDDREANPPMTVQGVLQGVADYLDLSDQAIAALAGVAGVDNPLSGDGIPTMQADLRRLARWFDVGLGSIAASATRAVCDVEGRS